MELYREIINQMKEWKEKNARKNFLVTGAKSVGKTTAVKRFAEENFAGIMFFDLKNDEKDREYFGKELIAANLLSLVETYSSQYENPSDVLLVFDGLDEEMVGKNSITAVTRFLTETIKNSPICLITGLQEKKILEKRFWVQYQIMEMFPMTLPEFMISNEDRTLVEKIENQAEQPLEDADLKKIQNYLRVYFTIGGMPSVVNIYLETRDLQKVYQARRDVYESYFFAIGQIQDERLRNKVKELYISIPEQLERQAKIFKYGRIKFLAGEFLYGRAMEWLADRKMIHMVFELKSGTQPLYTQEEKKHFIVYLNDIGILAHACEVRFEDMVQMEYPYEIKQDALMENDLLIQLLSRKEYQNVYFWRNPAGERVTFVCEGEGEVLPVICQTDGKQNPAVREFCSQAKNTFTIVVTRDKLEFSEKEMQIPAFSVWNL